MNAWLRALEEYMNSGAGIDGLGQEDEVTQTGECAGDDGDCDEYDRNGGK